MKTEGNIVTVVTCTYNRSKLIGSLYDSLLKQTDKKCRVVTDICKRIDSGIFPFMGILNQNKRNTKQNQHDRYHLVIVKMFLHPVIRKNTDHRCRNGRNQNMKPQFKNICFDPCARSPFCQRCYIVFSSKRPDLAPEQNNDRKNRSQLDHDLEQLYGEKGHLPHYYNFKVN